jgi:predicted anti-sigma-YlaC factor YlaD
VNFLVDSDQLYYNELRVSFMPNFVICEDLQINSSDANIKIHLENCQHHRNMKRGAETMKWYFGFKTKEQVESKAKFLASQTKGKWRHSKNCTISKN